MRLVVDTSVLVAIAANEPERAVFIARIREAEEASISAVSVLEAGIVLGSRLQGFDCRDLMHLVDALGLVICPFDTEQAQIAIEAYRRFGKGFDPQARLNLGDAVTYALARSRSLPLLYKGQDFSATDMARA